MNTQMKEYRKATLRLAYLLTLMLWTGSCIDMDINRNPYETTQDELMRENHIIGSSLKSMEALVVPTQEHLYQFVEAMCGGAYGRYFGETATETIKKAIGPGSMDRLTAVQTGMRSRFRLLPLTARPC